MVAPRIDPIQASPEAAGVSLGNGDEARLHVLGTAHDIAEGKQTEQLLRQNRDTFFNLIQNAPFGVYVVDAQFRLWQVSAASRKIFSNINPLIGRDFEEVIRLLWPDAFASEAVGHFRHTLQTGEPYSAQNTTEQRQNIADVESYDWKIERIILPDGQFGVVCYFYDITERRRAEETAREAQERLHFAANTARLTYVEVDVVKGGARTADNFAAVMGFAAPSGQDTDASVGVHALLEHVVLEDRARVQASVEAFISGKPLGKIDYRVLGDDQVERWIESSWSLEHNASGKLLKTFATNIDITERHQTEQLLRQNHDTFFNLIQNAPFGVYVVDAQFRMCQASRASHKAFANIDPLIGRDFEEILRLVWAEPFLSEVHGHFRHTLQTGEAYAAPNTTEQRRDTPDIESYDWKIERITMPDGQFGVVCYFYDITERMQAEQALRQHSVQFETLINEAPLGVILIDADFRIRQVNPTALPAYGNIPELIGRDYAEVLHILWPKAQADAAVKQFRHTLETGEPCYIPEMIEQRADRQTTEYYEWQTNRIPLPDGRHGVVCYFRDISEQVLAQQKIRDSEARYHGLFNSIDEGFCIIEIIFDEKEQAVDYRFLEVNPAFEKQTGVPNPTGKRMLEVSPDQDPPALEIYRQIVLTGEPVRFLDEAKAVGRYFDAYALLVGGLGSRKIAVVFNDITARMQAEQTLERLNATLEQRVQQRTAELLQVNIDLQAEIDAKELLRESTERLLTVAENLNEGLVITSMEGEFIHWNRASLNMHGFARMAEGLGQLADFTKLVEIKSMDGATLPFDQWPMASALRGEQVRNCELGIRRTDTGVERILSYSGNSVRDSVGKQSAFLIVTDITERRLAEEKLRELNETLERRVLERTEELRLSQTNYKALYNSMSEGFCVLEMIFDAQQKPIDYRYLDTNPAFIKNTGFKQLKGKLLSEQELYPDQIRLDFFGGVALSGEPVRFESQALMLDRWFDIYAFRIDAADAHHIGVVLNDITERKVAQQEIEKMAFYDHLTHLPNRRLLIDRLSHALHRSERSGNQGALLFLDLDNFKTINDTQGHSAGDRVLQQVAQLLLKCVREGDTVARLGGDEFVVLLEGLSKNKSEIKAQVQAIGANILTAFSLDSGLNSSNYHCATSIGVTLFSGKEFSVEDLLKYADTALYHAKADGRKILRFFNATMQTKISERAALEAELRNALQLGQFELHYQPIVDVQGHLCDVEALLYWNHPQKGLVPPSQFIFSTEESGLIHLLGEWVLHTACQQLALWAQQPATDKLSISVNISSKQFIRPDFVDLVKSVLTITKAPSSQLKLEITENLLISNMEDLIHKMNLLKVQGIGFLLDDFGTGYSSLRYLQQLPLDYLKIDKDFISDVTTNQTNSNIVKAILSMAHSLGLSVVAEGVESQEQWMFLKHHGCQAFQGYLFSKAVRLDELQLHGESLVNTKVKATFAA